MRIYVRSNFVVPGLGQEESVDVDCPTMTLRQFLENLSKRAATPIQYVRPGAKALNPDDWQVDVNQVPYQDCRDGLDTPLVDEDTVTLKILAFGGG